MIDKTTLPPNQTLQNGRYRIKAVIVAKDQACAMSVAMHSVPQMHISKSSLANGAQNVPESWVSCPWP